MAQTTTKLYLTKWAYVKKSSPSIVVDITGQDNLQLQRYASSGVETQVYVGFDALSASLKRKRLYSVSAVFAMNIGSVGNSTYAFLCPSSSDFNPSTLVWTNRPAQEGNLQLISSEIFGKTDNSYSVYGDIVADEERSQLAAAFLKNNAGFFYSALSSGATIGSTKVSYVYNKLGNNSLPYIEIFYDNSVNVKSKVSVVNAPTSGYVNPLESAYFSWKYEKDDTYFCADENFAQSSAVFYWKYSTDESYTVVQVSGSQTDLTIPANTFDNLKTVQWYIQGTDDGGTVSETPVYSFSTADAYIISTPTEPINVIKDGSAEIDFQWSYSSPNGTTPSGWSLWYKSANDGTYIKLVQMSGAATSYTAAANTFPAGEIQWYVLMYNQDNVGPSPDNVEKATFINYASPTVSNVSADAVPFSTVRWQASDQQAYRIMVDNVLYGPYFGTEKSFELPDYLADGDHVIKVSVVGTYSLWSDWGQVTVTIQNVPGQNISLDADAVTDVELIISTPEIESTFLIYRDDVLIAKTNRNQFTDRFVLGEHTYKVVSKLANGNYSISNEISRIACVKNANIALLEGGEWLEIKFNPKDQSDPQYTDSVMASYNHLSGSEFPSATVSQYRDLTVTFSAVFLYTQKEEQKRFESMFRKPVIIKFKDGTVFVGILGSWAKTPFRHFYMAYTFTVTQIDFEDYIDDTE